MKNYFLPCIIVFAALLFHACTGTGGGENGTTTAAEWLTPGDDDQKTIQTLLINAEEGDTLKFDEGTFMLNNSLSMDGLNNITIVGKGMDKTIFSYKEQKAGAEGLKVSNAKNFTIMDMAIEDTKGDAIKVIDSDGVVFNRVRTEWTGGADSTNGSYGLYPVSCKNVLMENCVAIGASDAGIYVGQTDNAIVRNNRAEGNVAGIEIENTTNADVYDNTCTNNTGGLLVFDLPDLPKKNGYNIKVHDNEIVNNNHFNFSPKGISVSIVPAGVGMLFMACQGVEAWNNTIQDHRSLSVAIVNLDFMKQTEDSLFNIYPSGIYIHDNTIANNIKTVPDTTRTIGKALYQFFGDDPAHIVYDANFNPELETENGNYTGNDRICITNNGDVEFFTIEGEYPLENYDCSLEPLAEVKLEI